MEGSLSTNNLLRSSQEFDDFVLIKKDGYIPVPDGAAYFDYLPIELVRNIFAEFKENEKNRSYSSLQKMGIGEQCGIAKRKSCTT
jgi:hypothetical protein